MILISFPVLEALGTKGLLCIASPSGGYPQRRPLISARIAHPVLHAPVQHLSAPDEPDLPAFLRAYWTFFSFPTGIGLIALLEEGVAVPTLLILTATGFPFGTKCVETTRMVYIKVKKTTTNDRAPRGVMNGAGLPTRYVLIEE